MDSNPTANIVNFPVHSNVPRITKDHLADTEKFKNPNSAGIIIHQLIEIEQVCPAVIDNIRSYISAAHETTMNLVR